MKECSNCKENKNIDDFGTSIRTKDKLNSWCKNCIRIRSKQWYKENKTKSNIKSYTRKKENRKWFDDFKKTLKCIKCGENHISCLDFHHIDPKQKEFGISTSISQKKLSKEKIFEEIAKCIVLCSNCHRKFHYLERIEHLIIKEYLKQNKGYV